MDKETLRRLGVPLGFLILFLVPALVWDTVVLRVSSDLIRRTIWIGHYVIGTCVWLTLAWLAIRILDYAVWPMVFERRLGYHVPRLLKDLVHTLVIVVAVAVITSVVFEKSMTGFLAASGMLGLVLGFAVRNTIADFFAGIALNLERSFTVGDRIELDSGERGEVMEINWRTTILKTLPGTAIIFPNSKMSSTRIENHDRPAKPTRQYLNICLDFEVPTERAMRILQAAAAQAQAALDDRFAPLVLCRDITERGMNYLVVYTVPQYPYRRARSQVIVTVMRHLSVAGIQPVYPKYDLYTSARPQRQRSQQVSPYALLKYVPLFAALDDSETRALAARISSRLFQAGAAIVEQGDLSTSMYVVSEGLLFVSIEQEDAGDPIKVAALGPGQFFGEMSLLTGEPRSATVRAETDALVYEITKEDIELLLRARPDMAKQLSEITAERELHNTVFMQTLADEEQGIEVRNFATQLLAKVRSFFGIGP